MIRLKRYLRSILNTLLTNKNSRGTKSNTCCLLLCVSDALMLTNSKDAVVAHFRGLVEGGAKVEVDMLDVLVQDSDVYLVWLMTAEFQPIRKPVTSKTIGITHARFNTAGEVILHQDFWDTGLGFYQHVPALGGVIKAINRRFTSAETPK